MKPIGRSGGNHKVPLVAFAMTLVVSVAGYPLGARGGPTYEPYERPFDCIACGEDIEEGAEALVVDFDSLVQDREVVMTRPLWFGYNTHNYGLYVGWDFWTGRPVGPGLEPVAELWMDAGQDEHARIGASVRFHLPLGGLGFTDEPISLYLGPSLAYGRDSEEAGERTELGASYGLKIPIAGEPGQSRWLLRAGGNTYMGGFTVMLGMETVTSGVRTTVADRGQGLGAAFWVVLVLSGLIVSV